MKFLAIGRFVGHIDVRVFSLADIVLRVHYSIVERCLIASWHVLSVR